MIRILRLFLLLFPLIFFTTTRADRFIEDLIAEILQVGNGAPCEHESKLGVGCIYVDNTCTCSSFMNHSIPMNGAPCLHSSGKGNGCIWIDNNCTCSNDHPPFVPPVPWTVNITTFNMTDIQDDFNITNTRVAIKTRNSPPARRRFPPPRPAPGPASGRRGQGMGRNANRDRNCPLIFDLNMDNIIHAASGARIGIDLNNDGIADASIAEGDGLLTIYSVDPSKSDSAVDLSGLFSTETFNPFTGFKMNTSNGFESLHQLAASAQQYNSTRTIMDSQYIYLHNLNAALNSVHYGLGFFTTLGASKISQVQPLGRVNMVRLKYIDRSMRSAEFLKEQAGHERVEFIEEGRFKIESNGPEYLITDAWYSNLKENDELKIETFRKMSEWMRLRRRSV